MLAPPAGTFVRSTTLINTWYFRCSRDALSWGRILDALRVLLSEHHFSLPLFLSLCVSLK